MKLRSSEWFSGREDNTFQHVSAMRAIGHIPESFIGRPIIGIANSWNDFNGCNLPHKHLVENVKKGVLAAGGYPMEFHTISTPADFMKPSDLMYRNLMSMDVEEMIRSLPIDGVVLLCECDKTCPAQLMAAASCNLPALQLAAGHRTTGWFKGKAVNYGTDLWRFVDERKSGTLSDDDWKELESCISCSLGGCAVMGTASTMKSMSEMLGMMMPGTSSIPATDARRGAAAEYTGRRIVEMVKANLRPSDLMTQSAFHNAIKLLAAIGGSTNAVLHLIAIAGRLGVELTLEDFSDLTKEVPLIVDLQPSGAHNMDDFYRAGGLPAVIRQLLPLLNSDCLSATGDTIGDVYGQSDIYGETVIRSLQSPIQTNSSIAVLRGNLAPQGAVVKRSACSPHLLRHTGRAVVFENYIDMIERVDDSALDVSPDSVLIMKHCGPIGAGMPEWGAIPIPKKLLKQGVRDMVRISDARMSGTSYGTIVLHVAPEAAVGGLLSIVMDGDQIHIDVDAGAIQLLIDEDEIQKRLSSRRKFPSEHRRGFPKLFADHTLQANEGCDLDFLRPNSTDDLKFISPIVGRG